MGDLDGLLIRGELNPLLGDAIVHYLRPLFGETSREAVRRSVDLLPQPIFRSATVVDSDVATGEVQVRVDGDPDGASASALAIGAAPPPGGRCQVVFTPGGGLLCLGSLGALRIVLPFTGDVSLTSTLHPLQIGLTDQANVAFDNNEVQARTGSGGTAPYFINHQGGSVEIASALVVDAESGKPTLGTTGTAHIQFSPSAGVTDLRFPQDLPTLGGGVFLWMVPGSKQVGYTTSSARFKEDIVTVDPAAAARIVAGLRPVRYRYRPHDAVAAEALDAHVAPNYGLVAEEVADLAPEVVAPDADGKPYGLDPFGLIGLLTAANQHLAGRVTELEGHLADLDGRLTAAGL